MAVRITLTTGEIIEPADKALIQKFAAAGMLVDAVEIPETSAESTTYLQDAERRADMSSTPITSRDGKVVPVNTSQLGADRVHVSDILKLESELDKAEQEADDSRAQKKSILGYYAHNKNEDEKIKPQEFKTYKFIGDRGQTVEFSGVSF